MFYKYPFIRYPPRRCSFWPCGPVDPACEEDPFQALASPDDLEEMGDQPPPPNTARLLDGTDQRSEVFFGWGGWKTCFKRWNMWGWRWIFRNAYMYMHTYDICSLCTTTFVFAFFCEGIVSNKWFVILRVGYLEAILWCYSAYLGWYGNHSKMEKHQFSYEDRLLT